MPLFGGPSREQREALVREQERQRASVASLESGGLPLRAQERLANLGQSAERPLFTSDLSAQEAALIAQIGYRPIGLVVGSSFYHVGILYAQYGDSELQGLTAAYTAAQDLAVGRMLQEARALRAHGVIGVRFEMARREWAESMVEVTVVGTAISSAQSRPSEPFTSDLSGQEFWMLHTQGYEPRALVYGNCVWVAYTTIQDRMRETSLFNQEMLRWTTSLSRCRSLAVSRLHHMASHSRADGVVGVRFDRRVGRLTITGSEETHHAIYLTVIGTAIGERGGTPSVRTGTLPLIDLRDRMTSSARQPADVTLE